MSVYRLGILFGWIRSGRQQVARWTLATVALTLVPGASAVPQQRVIVQPPPLPQYLCYRVVFPPTVDGLLSETSWQLARWSDSFVDIEGGAKPVPWRTRVKMLWDDEHLYVGAELEEPHLWATLRQRDTIVYHDNDFEVFIDPDGDTHDYFELEINALGTVWDLWLPVPYRDGGTAVTDWNIDGLQSAVSLDGTLNDPSDEDTGWTVELAIPWKSLMGGSPASPASQHPQGGDQWRMNFSRVQWPLEVVDSTYRKRIDGATGKPAAEGNWVWSPQGAVDMHRPERWGLVQFSDSVVGRGRDVLRPDGGAVARWALRQVYYAQAAHWRENNRYARELGDLGLSQMVTPDGAMLTAQLVTTGESYRAHVLGPNGQVVWTIQESGRVIRVVEQPERE